VLLAVRLTLGAIWARLKVALVERGSGGVLVIMMTVHLLLGGPAILMILARLNWALPWTRVCLLVLGQITRALELLVTSGLTAAFWCELCCRGRSLAAGHGAQDRLVFLGLLTQRSLETHGVFAILFDIDWESSCDRNGFTVLLDSYEFCGTSVLGKATVKSDFIGSVSRKVSKDRS